MTVTRILSIAGALILLILGGIDGARAEPAVANTKLDALVRDCAENKAKACFELGRLRRDSEDGEVRDASAAAVALKTACDKGHVQACNDLGDLYYFGRGVEQNRVAARALYEDACDKKNAEACFSLGYILSQNELGGTPEPRVLPLFTQACDGGYLDACTRLADKLIQLGENARARVILEDACKKGNEDSCISLAQRLLWANPFPADRAAGLAAYKQGCDSGGGRACFLLAQVYQQGTSAEDIAASVPYFRKGCDLGRWEACQAYGNALFKGTGVAADEQAALVVFDDLCKKSTGDCWRAEAIRNAPPMEKDCLAGNARQCLDLGLTLARNDGALHDQGKALTFFELACDKDNGEGCLQAGDGHWNSTIRNVESALRFYERACALDNVDGCASIGARLSGWPNIPADEQKAARFFAKGCALGDVRACNARDRFAGLAPDVQFEDATPQFEPPSDEPETAEAPRERCVDVRTEINGRVLIDRRCNVQVINGFDIKPGSAPWQALVERPKVLNGQQLSPTQRVLCGGSLIAKGWIVTAAHCLYGDGKNLVKNGYRIRLGLYDVTQPQGLSYPIKQVIPHEGFVRGDPKLANDIALVQYDINAVEKLGQELLPIRTIKIDDRPVGQRQIYAGMTTYAYGWGWTKATNGQASPILKGVKLALRTEAQCNQITRFSGALANSVLCAGGPAGEQACSGDSGGPLIFYGDEDRTPTLIGVVSAGKGCGTMGEPSRYTRVARVAGWIRKIVFGTTARR